MIAPAGFADCKNHYTRAGSTAAERGWVHSSPYHVTNAVLEVKDLNKSQCKAIESSSSILAAHYSAFSQS